MKVILKAYYKQKMHPKHFHKLHREIQSMKCLNGPYVAEFYATFEDPQCVYIIMEYCEGGDLFKTMLMHGGLLDEQWVCVEVRGMPAAKAADRQRLCALHGFQCNICSCYGKGSYAIQQAEMCCMMTDDRSSLPSCAYWRRCTA